MPDGVLIREVNGIGTTDDKKNLVIRGVRTDTGEDFVWGIPIDLVPGLIELASQQIGHAAVDAGIIETVRAFATRSTSVVLVGTEPTQAILTIGFSGTGALSFHLSAEQITALSAQLTEMAPRPAEESVH